MSPLLPNPQDALSVGHSKPNRKGLVYIGADFLPGVPARDLSAEEVEACGGEKSLLQSGLYARPGEVKETTPANPRNGPRAGQEE